MSRVGAPGARATAGVAAAFHAAYRLLASLFLPPEGERLATVVVAIPELRSITHPLSTLACGPSLSELLDRLEAFDDAELERLATDHAALFLSGSLDRAVQPYESWHLGRPDHEQPSASSELGRRYRASGLAVAIPGELPDHVAVELEFCAYLCHQEGDAEGPAVERWRRERRAFLVEHPLRWLDAFERALTESMPETAYAGFARSARLVATDDQLLLDVLLSG